eukprot:1393028-Amorphochlora_amoeboformis.AAC.2
MDSRLPEGLSMTSAPSPLYRGTSLERGDSEDEGYARKLNRRTSVESDIDVGEDSAGASPFKGAH